MTKNKTNREVGENTKPQLTLFNPCRFIGAKKDPAITEIQEALANESYYNPRTRKHGPLSDLYVPDLHLLIDMEISNVERDGEAFMFNNRVNIWSPGYETVFKEVIDSVKRSYHRLMCLHGRLVELVKESEPDILKDCDEPWSKEFVELQKGTH